jgi:hypothetical protein
MATNTYVALQKTTLTSTAATVTLSSIPQGYTDLVLVMSPLRDATSGGYITAQFNSDSASNYSNTAMYGTGTTSLSSRTTSQTFCYINWSLSTLSTTEPNAIIASFQNYSNTTTNKTYISRANAASTGVDAIVGLWRNTAAISTIAISRTTGSFASGSTFSLYGIAASNVGAKATGGLIASDATYWYHVFNSSGTFTPLQSLTCDYLTVAGGGGSGYSSYAGGGGAGGYIYSTGFSASATGYTVTVGAGGAAIASAGSKGNNGSNSQFGATTAAVGGGGGGSYGVSSSYWNGASGGSGGGGSSDTGTGGSATSGQGYAGGAANANGGGAGGGSSAVGTSYTSGSTGLTVSGGAGTANSISGTSVTYATGGRGRSQNAADTAQTGTANTGNGGGAGNNASGAGGSGIVIVRYAK